MAYYTYKRVRDLIPDYYFGEHYTLKHGEIYDGSADYDGMLYNAAADYIEDLKRVHERKFEEQIKNLIGKEVKHECPPIVPKKLLSINDFNERYFERFIEQIFSSLNLTSPKYGDSKETAYYLICKGIEEMAKVYKSKKECVCK